LYNTSNALDVLIEREKEDLEMAFSKVDRED